MTAAASATAVVVMAIKSVFAPVVRLLAQTTPASLLVRLRAGRSSLSAIPDNNNFTNGGRTVLV